MERYKQTGHLCARALDEFADKKTRKDRRYVFDNFPDYTREDDSYDNWKSKATEVQLREISINNGEITTPEDKQVKILDKNREDENEYIISGEISVKVDRIGFMFENVDISDSFKIAYIEWLCVTFCELWNRLAPHILQRREDRAGVQFVPYFEKMAYLSYFLYKRQRQDARIIVLNSEILFEKFREFRELWSAPE